MYITITGDMTMTDIFKMWRRLEKHYLRGVITWTELLEAHCLIIYHIKEVRYYA